MTSPNPHAIDADTLSGMKPLRKVVYSIGSNLGDRLGNLQGAVDALSDTPDVIVVDISSVYETDPSGDRRTVRSSSTWWWSPRPPSSRGPCWSGRSRSRTPTAGRATASVGAAHAGRGSDHGRQRCRRQGRPQAAASAGPRARVRPGAVVRGRPDRGDPGKGAIADLLVKADASGVVRRDDLVIERD